MAIEPNAWGSSLTVVVVLTSVTNPDLFSGQASGTLTVVVVVVTSDVRSVIVVVVVPPEVTLVAVMFPTVTTDVDGRPAPGDCIAEAVDIRSTASNAYKHRAMKTSFLKGEVPD